MEKNHPHLLVWCFGAFLLSSAIPHAGYALIPIYTVIEHRRRAKAARSDALAYKYALQALYNRRNKS